jgi:hypothetical protein
VRQGVKVQNNLPEVTARIISYQRYLNLARQHVALAKANKWEELIELSKVKSLDVDRPVAVDSQEGFPLQDMNILTDLLSNIIKVMTEYESLVYRNRTRVRSLLDGAEELERSGGTLGQIVQTNTYGSQDLYGKIRK